MEFRGFDEEAVDHLDGGGQEGVKPAFVDFRTKQLRELLPVHHWLVSHVA